MLNGLAGLRNVACSIDKLLSTVADGLLSDREHADFNPAAMRLVELRKGEAISSHAALCMERVVVPSDWVQRCSEQK